jgi:hypothetical protein
VLAHVRAENKKTRQTLKAAAGILTWAVTQSKRKKPSEMRLNPLFFYLSPSSSRDFVRDRLSPGREGENI